MTVCLQTVWGQSVRKPYGEFQSVQKPYGESLSVAMCLPVYNLNVRVSLSANLIVSVSLSANLMVRVDSVCLHTVWGE